MRCDASRVVLLSGATEANHAVVRFHHRQPGVILSTAIEHASLANALNETEPQTLHQLPLKPSGVIQIEALKAHLSRGQVRLISLHAAHNESGVLQPWEAIAPLAQQAAAAVHLDASQWLGKAPLDGLAQAADWVTASAHKFGGPKGAGFLLIPESASGCVLRSGGGQESGHRSGTEDVAGVAAMVAALEAAEANRSCRMAGWQAGRDALEARLQQSLPGTQVFGSGANRLANTSLLVMPRFDSARWVSRLDQLGIEVSSGSACKAAASRTLRISAWDASEADWQQLAQALERVSAALITDADQAKGNRTTVIQLDD